MGKAARGGGWGAGHGASTRVGMGRGDESNETTEEVVNVQHLDHHDTLRWSGEPLEARAVACSSLNVCRNSSVRRAKPAGLNSTSTAYSTRDAGTSTLGSCCWGWWPVLPEAGALDLQPCRNQRVNKRRSYVSRAEHRVTQGMLRTPKP